MLTPTFPGLNGAISSSLAVSRSAGLAFQQSSPGEYAYCLSLAWVCKRSCVQGWRVHTGALTHRYAIITAVKGLVMGNVSK